MHETASDLQRLQDLLDRSFAAGGPHLREVITPECRISGEALAGGLVGMCLLVLATSTRDGRPIGGAVDGFFFRGDFYFGSSPQSLRFRHINERPAVSATYLPSEEQAVTVHGVAVPIDVNAPEHGQFRQTLLDYYVPRFGAEWENMLVDGAQYARINAERMFTFALPANHPS